MCCTFPCISYSFFWYLCKDVHPEDENAMKYFEVYACLFIDILTPKKISKTPNQLNGYMQLGSTSPRPRRLVLLEPCIQDG